MPESMLDSVRELNNRFLNLVSREPRGWSAPGRGLSPQLLARVVPLSAAQKAAVSSCPYALFDLRFDDHAHWLDRLSSASSWRVAEAAVDAEILEFVRLALFFAWHVASTRHLAAQLLLGMQEVTAAAFRGATVDCLPSLAVTEAAQLTARWSECARYWVALTAAAVRQNGADLRRIQLYGLQLAAAARLS